MEFSYFGKRFFFVFVLLVIFSFLFHIFVPENNIVGRQILQNNGFIDDLSGWTVNGKVSGIAVHNRVLHLEVSTPQTLSVRQKIPLSKLHSIVQFNVRLASQNIQKGQKGWEKGRVLLVQYQHGKAIWNVKHVLAALEGTNNWREYSEYFQILPETTDVEVVVSLSHCSGELSCANIELYNTNPSLFYSIARAVVITLWLIFFLFLFGRRWRYLQKNKMVGFAIMLVLIMIVVGTSIPGKEKNIFKEDILNFRDQQIRTLKENCLVQQVQSKAETFIPHVLHLFRDVYQIDITKDAHFILFFLGAFFLALSGEYQYKIQVIVELFMLACGTELVQLFVPGRNALIVDIVIDMIGCLLGIGFVLMLQLMKEGFGRRNFG